MAEERTAVEIRDDREHGKLVALDEGGSVAGTIAYFVMYPEPGALVGVHTVVRPEHEGKGVAGCPGAGVLRAGGPPGVPVVPLCPYLAAWAERHPEQAPKAPDELVRGAERQLGSHPELL